MKLTNGDVFWCLLRTIIGIGLCVYLGFLKGVIAGVVGYHILIYSVQLILGWEPMQIMDSIFMLDNDKNVC